MQMIGSSLILFAVVSLESLVIGQDEYYAVSEKRDGTKYCGGNLANALRLVCGGFYNSMFDKKSDPGIDMEWLRELEVLEPNDEVEYLFRPRSHAQALIAPQGTFRRHARGVYDECCRKSCSVTEMMGYCSSNRT